MTLKALGTDYPLPTPASAIIEDFERSGLTADGVNYTGDTASFSLVTTPVKNGSNALEVASEATGRIVSTSGLDYYPQPGDVHEVWLRINSSGSAQHLWAAQDTNNAYMLAVTPTTLQIYELVSGSFTSEDSASISPPTDTYIRALVAYGDDSLSVTLDDGDGTDQYGSVTALSTQFTSGGGIGFRQHAGDADTGDQSWWDYVRFRNDIQRMIGSAFDPGRDPNNPLTSGTSGNPDQAYIPTVAKGPDGNFYQVTKSSPYLWGWSSPDGVTWTDEGQVLSLGAGGSWDDEKHTYPVLNYNPGDSTWYLFYAGDAETDATPRKVGLATSSSPLSGYTKHASNPLADATSVGSGYDMLQFVDHVVHSGTHYWYGYARDKGSPETNPWKLVVYSGADWSSPSFNSVLLSEDSITSVDGHALMGTSVFVDSGGTWRYTFTMGVQGDQWNERRLYSADGTGPTDFTAREDVMLSVGEPGSWEARRVYNSVWLKDQDGSYKTALKPDGDYWMYYSGHNVAGGGTNNAYNALARYSTLPDPADLSTMA